MGTITLLPSPAEARGFNRTPSRHYGRGYNRVNLHVYDGYRGNVFWRGAGSSFSGSSSSSSSFRAGGISGPYKNPDPDARKPENLTSCSYDANNELFYEREGKNCPFKRVNANDARIAKRKREWQKKQQRAGLLYAARATKKLEAASR